MHYLSVWVVDSQAYSKPRDRRRVGYATDGASLLDEVDFTAANLRDEKQRRYSR